MNTRTAAQGQWEKIFSHYGLPPITGKKHYRGKCPLCGRHGKFRIDDKDGRGTYICVCSAGTGFQLLERSQKKSFRTLADEVDKLLGRIPGVIYPQSESTAETRKRENILSCFQQMVDIKNTPAAIYLQRRGIIHLPENYVRFCPADKNLGNLSLWALATDAKNRVCYLHRTLIDGTEAVRRMSALQSGTYLEHAVSVAVRLYPLTETLGIAEGIETALSCHQLYGINTWSAMNAGFLAKFIAPCKVSHLIVFADTDHSAAGHAAAFTCARRNLTAGNDVQTVSVRWPDAGDFNDVLRTGSEIRQITFTRKRQGAV